MAVRVGAPGHPKNVWWCGAAVPPPPDPKIISTGRPPLRWKRTSPRHRARIPAVALTTEAVRGPSVRPRRHPRPRERQPRARRAPAAAVQAAAAAGAAASRRVKPRQPRRRSISRPLGTRRPVRPLPPPPLGLRGGASVAVNPSVVQPSVKIESGVIVHFPRDSISLPAEYFHREYFHQTYPPHPTLIPNV